ncbi:class I SAM-dependent methyltransferase [Sulfitobacter sp. HNIBRBA3233]|uniref:class I SAM-dependent DNA methyltransferase n=1 Tax=Sulfitobacter marinivivus TaxID=3158558 RepID=UPI0032E02C50
MSESFLDKAYAVSGTADLKDLYADWSGSYDDEVLASGYATPARCAAALAKFVEDPSAPVLDFGCGTGLSGEALKAAGFKTIDGIDMSPEMIAEAEAKSVYRSLNATAPDAPVPEGYATIAAIGVIGAGAAPLSTFGTLMHALPQKGLIVLSFNDHTLADRASMAHLNEWLDCGAAHLLFREHGPHLPAQDMGATVFVIQRA